MLCGVHHKAVDDHSATYPVAELLDWKKRQVAGPRRPLTQNQVTGIRTHYDLNALGPDGFEKMCQALAFVVLGPGTETPKSPHHSWDAYFRGRLTSFPTTSNPWDGYIVMQAIFKPAAISAQNASLWLRRRIEEELRRLRSRLVRNDADRPDYIIIASNVSLSTSPGSGGIDAIHAMLQASAKESGIKGFAIWGEADIARITDGYPQIRHAFANIAESRVSIDEMLTSLEDGNGLK